MLVNFYIEEHTESDTGVATYRAALPAHVNEYGITKSKPYGEGDSAWLAVLDLASKLDEQDLDYTPELFIMPVFEQDNTEPGIEDRQAYVDDLYIDHLSSLYSGEGFVDSDMQSNELNRQRAMNRSRF